LRFPHGKPHRPIADRLWEKVERGSEYSGQSGCWIWKGSRSPNGYGTINIDRIPRFVHRVVYELLYGPIPKWPERVVMHTCDNRLCVRPEHLMLGTQSDNLKDSVQKGRFISTRVRYGEASHFARLTQSQVDDIRALYWDTGTITTGQLARQYGVGIDAIRRAVNFETYSHGNSTL
jgi:hypothetical protein